MRTESDLMAAFQALERRADDYGAPSFRVVATEDARSPRARLAVSMLAAAALVAAAVGIALAVAGHRPSSSEPPADHRSVVPTSPAPTVVSTTVPAPRSFDPRRLSFSLDRINGVDIVQVRVFRQVQEVMLRSGAGDRWDVMLNAPGSWGPFATTGTPKVTVAGRPAFYGPTPDALPFAVRAERPVVLAWEYTPGAWGVVVSEDAAPIPLDVARMLAGSVHPGVLTSVSLPLRIRQAPPGMTVQGYVAETGR